MNNFLYLSLGVMILLFVIGQAYETSQLTTIDGITYNFAVSGETQTINDTEVTYSFGEQSLLLGINYSEGIMVATITIVAIVALVVASGIGVATWSLSETAQRAILNFGFYGGLWGIFSVTTLNFMLFLDNGINLGLGWLTFFLISLIHLIGIIKIINTGK